MKPHTVLLCCAHNLFIQGGGEMSTLSNLIPTEYFRAVLELNSFLILPLSAARWLQTKPDRRGGGSRRAGNPGVCSSQRPSWAHHLLEERQNANWRQGWQDHCECCCHLFWSTGNFVSVWAHWIKLRFCNNLLSNTFVSVSCDDNVTVTFFGCTSDLETLKRITRGKNDKKSHTVLYLVLTVSYFFFRSEGGSWWSPTLEKAMPACTSVWEPTWSERGTVRRHKSQCLVRFSPSNIV